MAYKNVLGSVFICVNLWLGLGFTNLNASRMPETLLRIRIIDNSSSINISCSGEYYLCSMDSGEQEPINPGDVFLVRPAKDGLLLNDKKIKCNVLRLIPNDNNNYISVNGRRYRDSILVKKINDKISVINEVSIDNYVCGILPAEVNPEWPMEALKAQAVVSRTFALSNLCRHQNEDFNLCNTVHCQVYIGMESEKEPSNKAVELTKGEVLTSHGNLINAIFHACCGGHTESNSAAWGGNSLYYLSGVKCKFCAGTKHYYWKKDIEEEEISNKLIAAGYKVGKIQSLTPVGKTKSGRAKSIKITYGGKSTQTLTLPAQRFRIVVSPWTMKSTKLTGLVKKGDKFRFTGYGWGHGVGMCQWGAYTMSVKGYKYNKILKYYYPCITQ